MIETLLRRAAAAAVLTVGVLAAGPSALAQNEDAYDASTVLATVGGVEVTLGDLVRERQALDPQFQDLPPEVLFEGLLEQYTRQLLFAQAAEAAGLDQTPEVAAELAAARRQVLADAYLIEALRGQYDAALAAGGLGSEVVLSQILLQSEEDALAVKAELDGGADFATVAEQRSTGPAAASGGALGAFNESELPAEFAAAVSALAPGEISDPIQTTFGFHVVRLEERREGSPPSFDQWLSGQDQDTVGAAVEAALADVESQFPISRVESLPPPESIMDDSILGE